MKLTFSFVGQYFDHEKVIVGVCLGRLIVFVYLWVRVIVCGGRGMGIVGGGRAMPFACVDCLARLSVGCSGGDCGILCVCCACRDDQEFLIFVFCWLCTRIPYASPALSSSPSPSQDSSTSPFPQPPTSAASPTPTAVPFPTQSAAAFLAQFAAVSPTQFVAAFPIQFAAASPTQFAAASPTQFAADVPFLFLIQFAAVVLLRPFSFAPIPLSPANVPHDAFRDS